MILSYNELVELVADGVITALPENINGASVDVRLASKILLEKPENTIINPAEKSNNSWIEFVMDGDGYVLKPGEIILASTMEIFNMPDNLACDLRMKSSAARAGLNHLFASYGDPYWTGSSLTLELVNQNSHHSILIKPGMKVAQMLFYKVLPVPYQKGYAIKGQYNGDKEVSASKGVK